MAVLIYPFFTNCHRRFPKADFISVILSIPTVFGHGILCIALLNRLRNLVVLADCRK